MGTRNTNFSVEEKMKVYFAGPYQWKERITEYAKQFTTLLGVGVTSTWLDESHAPTTQLQDVPEDLNVKYATQDLRDINRADAFVLFAVPATDTPIPRAGRHVEFGYALARGLPIYVVGLEKENIFHYLPGKVQHFETFADLVAFFARHPRVMGI
jgi:nucleoside 2-deoxyribosyltransferase